MHGGGVCDVGGAASGNLCVSRENKNLFSVGAELS